MKKFITNQKLFLGTNRVNASVSHLQTKCFTDPSLVKYEKRKEHRLFPLFSLKIAFREHFSVYTPNLHINNEGTIWAMGQIPGIVAFTTTSIYMMTKRRRLWITTPTFRLVISEI